jgi:hypothetical protein
MVIPTQFNKVKKHTKMLKFGDKYFGYTKKTYYNKDSSYCKEMC